MFGNAWPNYLHDWEDALAQQDADAQRLEEIERAKNRVRIQPTAVEISVMEIAIAWPARYLARYPHMARTVGHVALGRSMERDIEVIAKRLRLTPYLARQWNRCGLDLIASGLRHDRVGVF